MDQRREREIAQGLRAGKAEAWQALYDAYSAQVWRSVARLVGNAADAADVVQETFLAAARSARSFDPARGTLWMWLCGVARRHVALHFRKEAQWRRLREATLRLATAGDSAFDWLETRELPADEVLASAELALVVRAALAELPDDYQGLLAAKYLDGASVEEIVAQHSPEGPTTVEAVRSKLARARRAFKEVFARLANAPVEPSEIGGRPSSPS
jgi:RNA polymerase sigma-70 factor (ECF subfamily)